MWQAVRFTWLQADEMTAAAERAIAQRELMQQQLMEAQVVAEKAVARWVWGQGGVRR